MFKHLRNGSLNSAKNCLSSKQPMPLIADVRAGLQDGKAGIKTPGGCRWDAANFRRAVGVRALSKGTRVAGAKGCSIGSSES